MVPFYLSGGDPRKDYNFIYMLGYNPIHFDIKSSKWSIILTTLFNSAISAYVSLLAEKVTLPSKEVNVDPVILGNLELPYFKGFKLNNIQVQYLEDALGIVNWFHTVWQNSIRNTNQDWISKALVGGDSSSSGMVYHEIGKFTGSITYAPTRRLFIPSKSYYTGRGLEITPDLALTADVYPSVFPRMISTTPGDKTGANLSRVNVDFIRLPSLGTRTSTAYTTKQLPDLGLSPLSSKSIFH